MTRIAEIADRLHRLAKRREDEGIYTDASLCEEAAELLTTPANPAQVVSDLADRLQSTIDGLGRHGVMGIAPVMREAVEFIRSAAIGAGGQAVDPRHFEILAEAMAEVKATSDGLSDQPIADIVRGCIDEIAALPTHPAPSGQAVAKPTVNELFANCDRWGALEWFNRLAMAIHNRDKAVVEGCDLSFATYDNIAKSSAARLVHDFEQEVRSALSQPHPADERVVEALRKIEYCLTKDSLCEAEKIDDALYSVRRLIASKEGRS